jgi:hypothetical protein
MAPSQLGSATCSVLDIVRTDLRTVLAIALGTARVPARAGLAGENGDRSDGAMHPSKVAGGYPPDPYKRVRSIASPPIMALNLNGIPMMPFARSQM